VTRPPFPQLASACRGLFALIPGAGRALIHELGHTDRANRVLAQGIDAHVVALTGGFPDEVFR
jgi:hypothetical protein